VFDLSCITNGALQFNHQTVILNGYKLLFENKQIVKGEWAMAKHFGKAGSGEVCQTLKN
jgi:hypothetical protein